MDPECTDCGLEHHEMTECLATCCDKHSLVCPECWPRHYAQFYMDALGAPHGCYGANHPEVVKLMVQFRNHR